MQSWKLLDGQDRSQGKAKFFFQTGLILLLDPTRVVLEVQGLKVSDYGGNSHWK